MPKPMFKPVAASTVYFAPLLRALVVLFGCLALGEGVVALTGTRLPACVIGMLLLTLFLRLGWVKLHWVQGASDLLMNNLGLFFIPAGVSLLAYYDLLRGQLWAIALAIVLSMVLVLAVTGWTHQLLRRGMRRRGKKGGRK